MKFSEIFNNREIASAIWLTIAFLAMLFKRDIRKSLLAVLKSFFKIKIISHLLLMIGYISFCVFFLYYFNFWEIILLKDTVLWFCLTAFVLYINTITNNGKENFIKNSLLNSIKIIVVIQFIANSFTFSLVTELIILPIILIVVMMEVVSSQEEKYNQVNKIMNILLFIFSLAILINAVYLIVLNFDKFGNYLTLKKFLLPIILSVLYIPFLYSSVIISNYEQLFLRLSFSDADSKVKRYAKRRLLFYCRLSMKKINIALNMGNYNLMSINSNTDVDDMIDKYKNL